MAKHSKASITFTVTSRDELMLLDADDGDQALLVRYDFDTERYFYDGVTWRRAQEKPGGYESSRYARETTAKERLAAAVIAGAAKPLSLPRAIKPITPDMSNDDFSAAMRARNKGAGKDE